MERTDSKSLSQSVVKESPRAYGCPCGKAYLSYPALFTHVKQKHDGKPPGKLIKPKSGKVRGRPKTRIDPQDEELNQIMMKAQREVSDLIENQFVNYKEIYDRSEGNVTCQDISTNFIQIFQVSTNGSEDNGVAVLSCFLNELKDAVNSKFGEDYWSKERPTEIIEVANQLYSNHDQKQQLFPISKQLLKELTFHFFQWMFANKYTDHRLLKRALSQTMTTSNQ